MYKERWTSGVRRGEGLVQRSSSASMTHLLVITADHLPKRHLVAETVGRLIGIQGLAAQVWHGQVGGVRQQSRRVFGCPVVSRLHTLHTPRGEQSTLTSS